MNAGCQLSSSFTLIGKECLRVTKLTVQNYQYCSENRQADQTRCSDLMMTDLATAVDLLEFLNSKNPMKIRTKLTAG